MRGARLRAQEAEDELALARTALEEKRFEWKQSAS